MLSLSILNASNLYNYSTSSWMDLDLLSYELLPHLATNELFKKGLSINKIWCLSAIMTLSNRTKELSLNQMRSVIYRCQQYFDLANESDPRYLSLLSTYKCEIARRSAFVSAMNNGRAAMSINIRRNRSFVLLSVITTEQRHGKATITMKGSNHNFHVLQRMRFNRVSPQFYILLRHEQISMIMHRKNIFGKLRITDICTCQVPIDFSWIQFDKVWIKFLKDGEKYLHGRLGFTSIRVPMNTVMKINDVYTVNNADIRQQIEQQLRDSNLTNAGSSDCCAQ